MQVMGPDDSYMVQFSPDTKTFWADSNSLSLGGCFQRASDRTPPHVPVTEVMASAYSSFQKPECVSARTTLS